MKKKSKLLNALMVGVIILIGASAAITAGSIKGWFGGSEYNASAKAVVGSAAIERSGVTYSINSDISLKDKDIITTRSGSTLLIDAGENTFTLGEKSQVTIKGASTKQLVIEINSGEVFARVEGGGSVEVSFDGKQINTEDSVYSLNVQTGSAAVNVYAGEIETVEKGSSKKAKSGEIISYVEEIGTVTELSAALLNQFNMENIKKANDVAKLYFSDDQIDEVARIRAAEKQKALEGEIKEIKIGKDDTATEKIGVNKNSKNENEVYSCIMTITCETILDNMGELIPGKSKYVPSKGMILSTSKVEFTRGETAFDVLKRACDAEEIQLEYSYAPMYGSHYIEGINNIYEFDCGSQSGWMYNVNSWFPNYGCSEYQLKDGDVIVWCYTCKGLGADVGGKVY